MTSVTSLEGGVPRALRRLLTAVPTPTVAESLQAIADALPLVVPIDFVKIRLLGADGRLYLVAASGCTTPEIRKRALQPLPVGRVRDLIASGDHERLAHSLGAEWVLVTWLVVDDEEIATLVVGARTKRRPSEADLVVLRETADELASRLRGVDRSAATLHRAALRLARRWTRQPWSARGPSEKLRPRERTILELYADGLSTADIAALLVISPHTVRTHVKLALRRLGLHNRDEAAQVVRSDQLADVL